STVVDAGLAGACEPVAAGLADRLAAALMLVVGGDVADPGVQPVLWGSRSAVAVDLRVSAVQRLVA
ncbi:MAG: hypothetical protein ACOY42_09955, partial [Pseudomonadota bacterium]